MKKLIWIVALLVLLTGSANACETDIDEYKACLGESSGDCLKYDYDGNGTVGMGDYVGYSNYWNTICGGEQEEEQPKMVAGGVSLDTLDKMAESAKKFAYCNRKVYGYYKGEYGVVEQYRNCELIGGLSYEDKKIAELKAMIEELKAAIGGLVAQLGI